ncbi:phage tail assembly protein [Plantactinospora sp. WMMB782]|uniref:phage tail assembly protein n=1 Tax=Plantactinospora sp. WMMB782 TaxID=3404121 RepID=UPI003B95915B
MLSINLDTIREATERKYGHLTVEVGEKSVRLLNPLRLPKERREKLMRLQSVDLKAEGADQAAVLADAIRTVADTAGGAKILLGAIGDDLAVLVELFEEYGRSTRSGEASGSQS